MSAHSGRSSFRNHRWLRFSLRGLLIAVAVVGVATWWITWPERTRREVLSAIEGGKTNAATSRITFSPDFQLPLDRVAANLRNWHEDAGARSWGDLVGGRHRYLPPASGVAEWIPDRSEHRMLKSIRIERGRIIYEWAETLRERAGLAP
jgi:hypothetical protein